MPRLTEVIIDSKERLRKIIIKGAKIDKVALEKLTR